MIIGLGSIVKLNTQIATYYQNDVKSTNNNILNEILNYNKTD